MKMEPKSAAMTNARINRGNISDSHPVAVAHDIYSRSATRQNWAPSVPELLDARDSCLVDYTMFLAPMIRHGDPDCRIMLRGEKIPGRFDNESSSGCSYAEYLQSETDVNPSIMLKDVFGSIITRKILLAEICSPFKTHLSIAMYRGIFPIWNSASGELWAALVCAPKYAELPCAGQVSKLPMRR